MVTIVLSWWYGKMSMLDVLISQIRSRLRYGNAIKNPDGSISMILTENDVKRMIMGSISARGTPLPVPINTLENLISVKIDKGKIEVRIRVI